MFSSCSLTKNAGYTQDDLYLDPKKDQQVFYPKPVQAQEEQNKLTQKTQATQTDNNPYYQDKDFAMDDYYDSEYASRIRRFHNPAYGLGYYDSFYTNSYFYNPNPYLYNVSIYNGYNFWGSSYMNYMYNPGWNMGLGLGFTNTWNNWGMNSFGNSYYNPYYSGFGYGIGSPFGYGLNNYNPYYAGMGYGFNNGFYGGYYNSFDYNSNTYYGPRMSNSGFNSSRADLSDGNGRMTIPLLATNEMANADPTSTERFNQVNLPKENLHIIREQKNLANADPNYIPRPMLQNENSNLSPVRNNVSEINPRNTENPVRQNNQPGRNWSQNENPKSNWNLNSSGQNQQNPTRGTRNEELFSPSNSNPTNGSFESPRGGSGVNNGGLKRPR
jgi:hypothetical protein